MESKNQKNRKNGGRSSTTSSNIAVELFGPREPSSPQRSPFATLLAPPASTAQGRNYGGSAGSWRQQGSADAPYQRQEGASEWEKKGDESNYQNVASDSSNYFSSSIHYGGRETYSPRPPYAQSQATYKKDGEEDDADEKASRGNWWQGSLYY